MSLWLDSLSFGLREYQENTEEKAKCILEHLSMTTPRSWWESALQTGNIEESHADIIRDLHIELLRIPGFADRVELGLLVAMSFMDDDHEEGKAKYGDVYSKYTVEEYIDKAKTVSMARPELYPLIKSIIEKRHTIRHRG